MEERKKDEEIFTGMLAEECRSRQDLSETLMARLDENAKRRKTEKGTVTPNGYRWLKLKGGSARTGKPSG